MFFCVLYGSQFSVEYMDSQYYLLEGRIIAIMVVIRLISAVIFGGIGSKLLADGLARAGVLKGYALGQNRGLDLDGDEA